MDTKSTEEKSSIIINFPVPNTKEAIVEFLTQAISGSKADNSSALGKTGRVLAGLYTLGVSELIKKAMKSEVQSLAPAWRTKCEQIIIKARFSMKEDRETLNEINRFAIELGIK
ncbi:MAG: hypothetical protein IPN61_09135 [Bacteroidetes bacterium]|nr:hypothetical protein [Bacteroidota bacterium]